MTRVWSKARDERRGEVTGREGLGRRKGREERKRREGRERREKGREECERKRLGTVGKEALSNAGGGE